MSTEFDDETFTRRGFMVAKAVEAGSDFYLAYEAVASTAIEHPEWDMTERKTWREWEAAREQEEV